ncbi:hypothetical protein ABIB17_003957 [Arthrobacter sp. UYEF6]
MSAFIKQAEASFPGIPFRVASLTSLGVPEGYASGILAWYSLIHFAPDQVPSILRELARRLTPCGLLLLGLFEGYEIARFPDVVSPAYSWPVAALTMMLCAAGFETILHQKQTDPGYRPHTAISAHA